MKKITLTNVLKLTSFLVLLFLSAVILVDAFTNGANV